MENGNAPQKVSWVERAAHIAIGLLLAYPTIIGLLNITVTLLSKSLLIAGFFLSGWFAAIALYAYYVHQKMSAATQPTNTPSENSHDDAV